MSNREKGFQGWEKPDDGLKKKCCEPNNPTQPTATDVRVFQACHEQRVRALRDGCVDRRAQRYELHACSFGTLLTSCDQPQRRACKREKGGEGRQGKRGDGVSRRLRHKLHTTAAAQPRASGRALNHAPEPRHVGGSNPTTCVRGVRCAAGCSQGAPPPRMARARPPNASGYAVGSSQRLSGQQHAWCIRPTRCWHAPFLP